MKRPTVVTLHTRTLGEHFATAGIVRRRGRIIHLGQARPYGFVDVALKDARAWAEAHGYDVKSESEEES